MIELITFLHKNENSVINNFVIFVEIIKKDFYDTKPTIEQFDNLVHSIFEK